MDKNSRILIVGAGAFGTSTAYHLSQRGYKSIRVLDKYPVPSIDAASTDISKVIRFDYNEPLYARLALEAIEIYKSSDLYRDLYHVPGWVLSALNLSVPFVKGSISTSERLGVKGLEILSKDQVRQRIPQVKGDLDGWNINVWNPSAGWVASGEALKRMAEAAQANGVEFVSGTDRGAVTEVIVSNGKCTGVRTREGTVHTADVVVLAAGAWLPRLIDLKDQLIAKGHSVAHIQLSPEEAKRYQNMPIMDNLELGYFFPPAQDGVFKTAHSQFITNTVPKSGVSIPHTFVENPDDGLPLEIEATMRRNIRRVLPELADRPFSFTRLCWDADTPDRHFLITPHPDHKGLFIAGGGSAHGFKFMPVLGKYIADLLEGTLEPNIAQAWRWRPNQKMGTNLAHMDPEMELRDLSGWRGRRRNGPHKREARL
ncbi:L-pipecolate oxidase [Exophiala dermatitidis]